MVLYSPFKVLIFSSQRRSQVVVAIRWRRGRTVEVRSRKSGREANRPKRPEEKAQKDTSSLDRRVCGVGRDSALHAKFTDIPRTARVNQITVASRE